MKVLVWLPLPEESHWVGEGIAQTLERWLETANDDTHFTLFVNSRAKAHLEKLFKEKKNIRIITNSFFEGRNKIEDFEKVGYAESYKQRLLPYRLFSRLTSALKVASYILKTYASTLLYNKNLLFSGHDILWAPSPSIPFVERLRTPIAYFFWDPFVFEYDEFKYGPRLAYLNKLRIMFWQGRRNAHVFTQSEANQRFLNDILGLPVDRVHYVRLGCPDYMPLVANNYDLISQSKRKKSLDIYDLWVTERKSELFSSKNPPKAKDVNKLIEDTAMFFRYANNLQEKSRLILVSTQNRPYKGLLVLLASLAELKKISKYKLHVAFTCSIPDAEKRQHPELYESILEFSRLSNKMHAILTASADLVLHPSFVEGGLGSYPMYEAASVNVPSLTNMGRHTAELVSRSSKRIEVALADFTKTTELARRIENILDDEQLQREIINEVSHVRFSWQDSTKMLLAELRNAGQHEQE